MEAKETKIIYYIDGEETPYLVTMPISPDKVTLTDFKNVLNQPNYKFLELDLFCRSLVLEDIFTFAKIHDIFIKHLLTENMYVQLQLSSQKKKNKKQQNRKLCKIIVLKLVS